MDPLYQDLLREAGVVEAVLGGMLTYPTSLGVQMAGCESVLSLAQGNEKTRIKLGAHKACNVLVAALQRFSQESVGTTPQMISTPLCLGGATKLFSLTLHGSCS